MMYKKKEMIMTNEDLKRIMKKYPAAKKAGQIALIWRTL